MDDSLTPAQHRVVAALKRHGPATPESLAGHLGLTGAAVRQHLASLDAAGLARSEAVKSRHASRGRPSMAWSLTDAAQAQFPDRHADLTVDLIESIRATLGQAALDKLISDRSNKQLQHYLESMPSGRASLKKRVAALASMRTNEGYMAEVVEESPGVLRLIEHHCPICAAAETCQGFCQAELDVFQRALGPDVEVERTAHQIIEGDRCVYRIRRK